MRTCVRALRLLREPSTSLGLSQSEAGRSVPRARSVARRSSGTTEKVGARVRAFRLLAPLYADLYELRLTFKSRQVTVLATHRDKAWSQTTYNNWRRRIFKRYAPGQRPYSLRHTFVSLLIYEGMRVPEVARQAGHGPELVYGHTPMSGRSSTVRAPLNPGYAKPDNRCFSTGRKWGARCLRCTRCVPPEQTRRALASGATALVQAPAPIAQLG